MIRGSLPPMSNRESFIDDIELVDADDGTLWDLTDVTAQIVLERASIFCVRPDYAPYLGFGLHGPTRLLATTENGGVQIIDTSLLFTFTEDQMRSLPAGQYRLSAVIVRYGESVQLYQLDIPILDGGVPL